MAISGSTFHLLKWVKVKPATIFLCSPSSKNTWSAWEKMQDHILVETLYLYYHWSHSACTCSRFLVHPKTILPFEVICYCLLRKLHRRENLSYVHVRSPRRFRKWQWVTISAQEFTKFINTLVVFNMWPTTSRRCSQSNGQVEQIEQTINKEIPKLNDPYLAGATWAWPSCWWWGEEEWLYISGDERFTIATPPRGWRDEQKV